MACRDRLGVVPLFNLRSGFRRKGGGWFLMHRRRLGRIITGARRRCANRGPLSGPLLLLRE
jgi:hypothetical protein